MLILGLITLIISVLYYLLLKYSSKISFLSCLIILVGLGAALKTQFVLNTTEMILAFVILAVGINFWLAITDRDWSKHPNSKHPQYFSRKTLDLRKQVHHFRFKGILGNYRQSRTTYLTSLTTQFANLNRFVKKRSHYPNLIELVRSIQEIKARIDGINLKFKLPFQINYPSHRREFITQFRKISHHYLTAQRQRLHRLRAIRIIKHRNPHQFIISNLNLYFNGQRLLGDRFTSKIDLLIINSQGIFNVALLDPKAKHLLLDRQGHLNQLKLKSRRKPRLIKQPIHLNVVKKIKRNYRVLSYILPNRFTNCIRTRIMCINPQTEVLSTDPKWKISSPQNVLKSNRVPVHLNSKQINFIHRRIISCRIPNPRKDRPEFKANYLTEFKRILTYLQDLQKLADQLSR